MTTIPPRPLPNDFHQSPNPYKPWMILDDRSSELGALLENARIQNQAFDRLLVADWLLDNGDRIGEVIIAAEEVRPLLERLYRNNNKSIAVFNQLVCPYLSFYAHKNGWPRLPFDFYIALLMDVVTGRVRARSSEQGHLNRYRKQLTELLIDIATNRNTTATGDERARYLAGECFHAGSIYYHIHSLFLIHKYIRNHSIEQTAYAETLCDSIASTTMRFPLAGERYIRLRMLDWVVGFKSHWSGE